MTMVDWLLTPEVAALVESHADILLINLDHAGAPVYADPIKALVEAIVKVQSDAPYDLERKVVVDGEEETGT